jgi:predicted transcriptional regulator
MPTRRSKFEIYVDILTQIRSGVNIPTRIMYSSNLSWKPLKEILESLQTLGLIEKYSADRGDKRSKEIYRVTKKGDEVLIYFNKAFETMGNRPGSLQSRPIARAKT